MKEAFHERLKRLREEKGWALPQLGKRSLLTTATLAALEAPSRYPPSWLAIIKLASALGTNPFYLATGEGDDKPFRASHRQFTGATAHITTMQ